MKFIKKSVFVLFVWVVKLVPGLPSVIPVIDWLVGSLILRICRQSFHRLTVIMTIFKTLQTANVLIVVKSIHDHHLLHMLSSLQQKSAFIVMPPLAIVANHSLVPVWTIAQDMTKTRTFEANESLRTLVWLMLWRKTKKTRKLVQTSEIVMSHSLASETFYILWKISNLNRDYLNIVF